MNPAPPTAAPTGHPWVLLRGLARESGHWGSLIEQWRGAFPGVTVLALDAPGCGARHALPSPWHVSGLVQDYRCQLIRAGWTGPYRLLAVSMGGMAAVAWAQAYPHEVAAQVLINTSMRPYSAWTERLQMRAWWPLLRGLSPGVSAQQREAAIWRLTSRMSEPSVVDGWVALARAHPVLRRNALRQLVAAARFKAPSEPPSVPTLLLASTQDELVHVRCSRALAAAWGVTLVEHPQAGHDLPLDAPHWVLDQVARWLQRV